MQEVTTKIGIHQEPMIEIGVSNMSNNGKLFECHLSTITNLINSQIQMNVPNDVMTMTIANMRVNEKIPRTTHLDPLLGKLLHYFIA